MKSQNESLNDDKSPNINRKSKPNFNIKLKLEINNFNSNSSLDDSVDSADHAKQVKVSKKMDNAPEDNDTESYSSWVITEISSEVKDDNIDNTKLSKETDDKFSANRWTSRPVKPELSSLKIDSLKDSPQVHFATNCPKINKQHQSKKKTNSLWSAELVCIL